MAKTGAKNTKTLPIQGVNSRQDQGWFNRYSSKNAARAARKEPRAIVPVPPRKIGAR